MYFDTHTHLDDERFQEDRDTVVQKMRDARVSLAVNIGADMESSRKSIEIAKTYDGIYAAVGVHPHAAEEMSDEDIATLAQMSKEPKVVAIGEIGLDYYYDNSPRELQKQWFRRQIELAKELDLPYVVHDRDAHADCMQIIKDSGYFRGVMHCYSGSPEMAQELLKLGFYISFAGPVTFKNGKKAKEAANMIPMDRLLIETDSPYLTPEPHRGKRNDSSYVPFIAKEIAAIKGLTVEETARLTCENGKRFFGIK
ncbi:MAG: TatD family deoxyribonuclease [Ruminococcaceae bacterium]|nr:TatD family deoxyribonuclease [Oscillospiraceae bacterium]